MGFSQTKCDPCIYVNFSDKEVFIIAVYVDDIILAGESDQSMTAVKKVISNKFDMEDLGELHHFLGVKVIQLHESDEIFIGQPSYCKDLLRKFNMDKSNPIETPVDVGLKLMKGREEDECFDRELYQSAVGSLLYLSTRTRPDIAYAVGFHGRTKHIDIKFHYVREQMTTGNIVLNYCKSCDMVADIFTKGLCSPQFKKLRSMMGLTELKS